MAHAAVGVCSALVVALLLAAVQCPRTSHASSLHVRPSDEGNASCPWRFNLIDDHGNRVERCVDELSITFRGTPSVGATTHALPDQDSASGAAPSGYAPLHGGSLYKLHARPARWHAAKEACEREGAHLLVVDSAEEAQVVRSLLGLRPYDNATVVHAGFYVALVTVLGETLQFAWHERWVRGEPDAAACGQVDSDGFLLVASCVEERSFVCEYEPSLTPPTASPAAGPSAPPSWNPSVNNLLAGYEAAPGWNNSYYLRRVLGTLDTWITAERDCDNANAHLASFESEEEIQAVVDLLQKQRNKIDSVFNSKIYVGVRTGELTTVLGDLLHESGFNRWKEESLFKTGYESYMCFWIDYKLFLHSIGCRRSTVGPKDYLCEFTGSAFPVHDDADYY